MRDIRVTLTRNEPGDQILVWPAKAHPVYDVQTVVGRSDIEEGEFDRIKGEAETAFLHMDMDPRLPQKSVLSGIAEALVRFYRRGKWVSRRTRKATKYELENGADERIPMWVIGTLPEHIFGRLPKGAFSVQATLVIENDSLVEPDKTFPAYPNATDDLGDTAGTTSESILAAAQGRPS